mgnify:FL=1
MHKLLLLIRALATLGAPFAAKAQLCGKGDFPYGVPGTPRERGVTLAVENFGLGLDVEDIVRPKTLGELLGDAGQGIGDSADLRTPQAW